MYGKNLRQTLIVGALTISSVIGALVFMHAVKKGISTSSYRVWTLLPDANGLYKKSKVMIAGVIVGEIVSIRLMGNRARVDLNIRRDVKLYRNASIAKVSLGLLGDKALVLDPGDPKTGFIGDGGQIKNVRQVGLSAVIDKTVPKIGEAIPHLVKLTRTLSDLSAGPQKLGRGSIREIAESIRTLAKALSQSVVHNRERIERIIRAVEKISVIAAQNSHLYARQISTILRDIKEITENFKKLSAQEKLIRETLDNVRQITGDLREFVAALSPESSKTLRNSLASLEKTMKNLQSISDKIDKGKGTLGKLISDDKVIKKVEGVVSDINDLVKKFSLLETKVRWRTDYYFLKGRFRNALRISLQLSPDKYYTISLVDDPGGVTSTQRRIVKSSDPRKPQLVQEEETIIKDTFRLSFQINFKLWLFALRGGIIENSGGFGFDFFPYKDYFVLSGEVFNFSPEKLPRLRFLLSLNYKFFTLAGGIDDTLNPAGRDFFLGLGIRFTDNDLKYLLPSLPLPK